MLRFLSIRGKSQNQNDKKCEWRTEEWLEVSLTSLLYFSSLENRIDTSDLTVDLAADLVMRQNV